jgi:hypothetical protein
MSRPCQTGAELVVPVPQRAVIGALNLLGGSIVPETDDDAAAVHRAL